LKFFLFNFVSIKLSAIFSMCLQKFYPILVHIISLIWKVLKRHFLAMTYDFQYKSCNKNTLFPQTLICKVIKCVFSLNDLILKALTMLSMQMFVLQALQTLSQFFPLRVVIDAHICSVQAFKLIKLNLC
jgi:hypothetical protein